MKKCAKPLQRIRKAGKLTYKLKMQKNMQSDTQINVHNTYQNTVQSAKVKHTKKCTTNFALSKSKKKEIVQKKKRNVKKICMQNECAYTIMQCAGKSASISNAMRLQTWPTALANRKIPEIKKF